MKLSGTFYRDTSFLPPTNDAGMVNTQVVGDPCHAASPLNDLTDSHHAAECGTFPPPCQQEKVGKSRPAAGKLCYPIDMPSGSNASGENSPKSIGMRLRELRNERSMTQVDVATLLGVSRSHISKLENGEDTPGRDLLMSYAVNFDSSLDWIASGLGEMHPGASQAKTADEALWLSAYRAMPEEEAKTLLEYLVRRLRPRRGA